MTAVLGSVVIPAHNEETVIGQCLTSLLMDFDPDALEIVVVCNGCSDRTADVARRPGVTVVSLEVASKPAALRAGERYADAFPRLYLDADVVLPASSARAVLGRLRAEGSLAARPPIQYETGKASGLVRSYYRARARNTAVMSSLWGSGVYGLSSSGRARFEEFPDLVADDLFVDGLFSASEIELVDCAPAIVTTPLTSRDLVRVMRRLNRGNHEHGSTDWAHGYSTTGSTVRGVLRTAMSSPAAALDASTYLGLATIGRLGSRVARHVRWERDERSRVR
jgi:glycosyltransferase involved in cell wall biosynthesis